LALIVKEIAPTEIVVGGGVDMVKEIPAVDIDSAIERAGTAATSSAKATIANHISVRVCFMPSFYQRAVPYAFPALGLVPAAGLLVAGAIGVRSDCNQTEAQWLANPIFQVR
jgi:hypothetical protein